MRFHLHRESMWIPVVLIVILVGCWSELDLYAPSFPQMMHYFATNEQMMQWTLSLNFLGFFLASLLCGPLADSFGRTRVILGGCLLFLLGSTICMLAQHMNIMLLGRLVQGIGVSAPVTVCMAVIADIYQGDRQVRILSRMNSAVTVTMALAPIMGVYLTSHLGWRSNFVVIFAIAALGLSLIWLLVPETHHEEHRTRFSAPVLMSNYLTLLKSAPFMASVLGLCLMITPYFIFIGIVPLLFMETLGVSIDHYAFYQGSVVGLFSALSLLLPLMLKHFDVDKMNRWSIVMSIGAIGVSLALTFLIPDSPVVITALMLIYVMGVVVPPTLMFAQAMDLHPNLRASASSLMQSFRMLSMAVGTAIAGALYNDAYFGPVVVMFTFVVASTPFVMYALRIRAQHKSDNVALSGMH